MRARELMTPAPRTIRPEARLREAIDALVELDVRHLPVVNGAGELVGMISDRDLPWAEVYAERAEPGSGKHLDSKVQQVMTGSVISVDEHTKASEIIDLLLENKIGALPVTDVEDRVVGIISYVDVLRWVRGKL